RAGGGGLGDRVPRGAGLRLAGGGRRLRWSAGDPVRPGRGGGRVRRRGGGRAAPVHARGDGANRPPGAHVRTVVAERDKAVGGLSRNLAGRSLSAGRDGVARLLEQAGGPLAEESHSDDDHDSDDRDQDGVLDGARAALPASGYPSVHRSFLSANPVEWSGAP